MRKEYRERRGNNKKWIYGGGDWKRLISGLMAVILEWNEQVERAR